MFADIIKMFIL